ncbi:MAG: bestrophin family ion channel [Saprospiraceae bacterium]|nr:bestrophin family ion channel [Saprospiraceae bacterium]
MISYDPKDWYRFLFRLHKTDTIRKLLPLIVLVGLYAWLVAWLEMELWRLSENSRVRNVTIMHTLLGFVISFLLVFRTNTAYERWWEGRRLWGALVNSSRNLAMKLSALLPEQHADRDFFRTTIPLYAQVLKEHLGSESTRISLFDNLPVSVQEQLDRAKHLPNQVALLMYRRAATLHREGVLSGEELLFINAELLSFTDICGACERIRNTPIPFSYSSFIKKFISVYILTLPFGFVFSLGYLVIPIVVFIFYVLASLEVIAEEIEEPFGGDANDLPLGKIVHNLKSHIHELI